MNKKLHLIKMVFCCLCFTFSIAKNTTSIIPIQGLNKSIKENKNIPLKKGLKKIETNYGVNFIYNNAIIEGKTISENRIFELGTNFETNLNKLLHEIELHTKKIESKLYVIQTYKTPINTIQSSMKIDFVPTKLMQDRDISGTILDENGLPLAFVEVSVKGTLITTQTDENGNFTLKNIDENAVLVFNLDGFGAKEISISGKKTVNITMKAQQVELKEVVISTGYTSQKRASISGAVSSVNMDNLAKTKVVDVAQALQGQVPGVFVAANTGAPGDGIKIRIRGEGTIWNNDVLYVIDGVPTSDITFLNQADIKTMTVLKDGASASIYGSRAAGGVVLITTKNGTKGKSTFDVDFSTGLYTATNLPKMLNAEQYLNVKDQAWHNSVNDKGIQNTGISPYLQAKIDGKVNGIPLSNTNWTDELFTIGTSKNLQVSTSGGSDNIQYLISGGYFGQNGIILGDKDKFERINFRTNINANINDRFKVGTNVQLSYAIQDKLSSSGDEPGIIRHALLRPPVLGVYKDVNDPTYSERDPYTDLPFYNGYNTIKDLRSVYENTSNPLAIVNYNDDKRYTYQTFGNIFGEYALLKDKSLKFKSNIGVDIRFQHNKNFKENFGDKNIDPTINDVNKDLGRNNRPNSLSEDRGDKMNFTFTNTLNYIKTFNKHNLNVLLGMENITNKESAIGASRQNYDNASENFRYLDYGGNLELNDKGEIIKRPPHVSSADSSYYLLSYFSSATYGFDNKYFATTTMRADASSRFGPNNKWGYFPSISASWVISQESFMKNINWMDHLKLRASWGQTGNQQIPNHGYKTFYKIIDGEPRIVRYGNPDIKWETTIQTNLGIDISILKNSLSFTADYFTKNTDDILLPSDLPNLSVGQIDPTFVNIGSISNKGFEFGINYQNNKHEFKYNISANLATLENKVEKLINNTLYLENPKTGTRIPIGYAKDSYYGLVFDGIYQNQEEINSHLYSNTNGAKPGDIKFKDLNGDGEISEAKDRTYIGNPNPKITYAFSFNASYQNFDFSFMFQGVNGVDRYNNLKHILDYDSRPFNSTTNVLNAWNGEGSSNTTPRLTFNDNGSSKFSSKYIEDASYLRLKNIEIGYTLSSIKGIKNVRFYVSAQNLLTFTKYTGLDPESTNLIDMGTYPQSKAFIFGLKLKL